MGNSPQQQTDELLLAVGYGLRAWAAVEDALLMLFIEAAKTDPPALAIVISRAIVSFEARTKVCNSVMLHRLKDNPDLEVWVKLVARVLKFYKKRHELAHFDLATEITGSGSAQRNIVKFYPYGMLQSYTGENDKTLSLAEIQERAEKFDELREALAFFWAKLIRSRATNEEFPERVPRLIDHFRTLIAQNPEGSQRQNEPSPK